MQNNKTKRYFEIINNFSKSGKILIIGDLMLDQFIWGDVSRISPEAPVPVVLVERESFMPGGAANVACGISALMGKPLIVGVVGKDEWGRKLKQELKKRKVGIDGIVENKRCHTSLKTRIVARHQQVVRVDKEKVGDIQKNICKKIINYVRKKCNSIAAIIIEDYGKGIVNPLLIQQIVKIAKKKNILVTVDPKEDHFSFYKGITCITPNQAEAEKATGIKITDKKSLCEAGKKLLKILDSKAVLITRGENGMCLFQKGKKAEEIPTRAQEVFDVSGAGDTVIGAFTLALTSGATFNDAAHISNYAAGIVVGKIGVGTCNKRELTAEILKDNLNKQ